MAERRMKILIISEYIAPIQAIASIRWTKIAKYLKKNHNVNITILTNEKNYGKYFFKVEKKDALLIEDIKYFDEYLEAKFHWLYIIVKNLLAKHKGINSNVDMTVKIFDPSKKDLLNCWKRILSEIVHDVFYFLQTQQCMKRIKEEKFDYDVIISTFGPIWPHMIAEKLKKQHPDVLWLADFRDPYARLADISLIFAKHKKYTIKHLENADIITKVNEYMHIYERKGKCVEIIPNGYEPEEMKQPAKPCKFIFAYTGILYEGLQDMVPLLSAIKELINEGTLKSEDVEIHYAGGCFQYMREQSKKVGMERFLFDHGYLSREKALELQRTAAILFQAGMCTSIEQVAWTGKTYEYMMAKKPIVYLMSGGSSFSSVWRLIGKLGGICYEESRCEETFKELKNYITNKYNEWKSTGEVTIVRDEEYISQFAYPNIAERIWEIINS